MCFLFICLYLFVAIAKVCRGQQLSCLFVSVEESEQIHQTLEIKKTTNCQVWRLNKKSLISMQDSYFIVGNKLDKERVKNRLVDEKIKKYF